MAVNWLCMDMKTAGMVIGWFGGILSMFFLLMLTVVINLSVEPITNFAWKYFTNFDETLDEVCFSHFILVALWGYWGLQLINMVASLLLIAGLDRKNFLLLLPFIVNTGASFCFSILMFLYFLGMKIGLDSATEYVIYAEIFAAGNAASQVLIGSVIYSLYYRLQKQEKLATDESEELDEIYFRSKDFLTYSKYEQRNSQQV